MKLRPFILLLLLVEIVLVAVLIALHQVPALRYPECWFAKKEVPFHQGMELCPGQSAIVLIPLELPKEAKHDDDI